jgi:signal transduction histidine kinase
LDVRFAAFRGVLSAPLDRRTWLATSYAMFGTVVGALGAVVLLLVLASLALSFTVVGSLALLGATLVGARRLARAERARAEIFFGVTIADPHLPTEGKWWQRVVARATRSETWREVAYLVLLTPISVIGAILVLAAWTGAAVFLLLPMYNPALANGGAHLFNLVAVFTGRDYTPIVVDSVPGTVAVGVVGIGLALAAPWIARTVAGAECRLATILLGPSERAALATRVDELRARREQLFDVVEAERRRIERDLHDGAQQRLVALAMNLGMAKEKFDKDPGAARALVEEAHQEAKQAMVELRNLARGIHPAVLSDRGLDAALSSLAGRAPVPVAVEVHVPERPPAAVETTAYFVVAEALTNIARHSGASRAAVTVARNNGHLTVEVTDDGVGGADTSRGTGLAGLMDRVQAVDGTLRIHSPSGGPTILTVELPCGS